MEAKSCLGFAVDCGVMLKGIGVVAAGFLLFVGSIYVLLSAIFGRWMGYLVLMVAFSGWMIIQSSLWLFGFWSQGPGTKPNLGPRGSDPAWVVTAAGLEPGGDFTTFASYPGAPWAPADENDETQAAAIQSVQGAATTFLADQANEQLGKDPTAVDAVTPSQFTVDSLEFATDGRTPLAVVQVHFNGGGPQTVISLYHDSGSVPRYSYMFLAGSVVLFVLHLPLLDRAERKRKTFLTGGAATPWYGPA